MGIEEHRLLLVRHGETEWSARGRHTGRTELELTDTGRRQAVAIRGTLTKLRPDHPLVITSPRRRARETAELAGLRVDEVCDDLAEWDYGRYEGLTTAQIRRTDSDWLIWTHGGAGGETVAQVRHRAERAIALALRALASRDVVFVGHGHFSRAVITRWLELPMADGARFAMAAGSVAVCGFEHGVRQLAALGLTGSGA